MVTEKNLVPAWWDSTRYTTIFSVWCIDFNTLLQQVKINYHLASSFLWPHIFL